MTRLETQITERGSITIEQAGIAKQSFEASEAVITVFLEDIAGNRTEDFQILAWFSDTDKALIGFGGVLERAILHLDMPHLRGYLDFEFEQGVL